MIRFRRRTPIRPVDETALRTRLESWMKAGQRPQDLVMVLQLYGQRMHRTLDHVLAEAGF